jgi:DNA-binding CsgD family transcriptional regulator
MRIPLQLILSGGLLFLALSLVGTWVNLVGFAPAFIMHLADNPYSYMLSRSVFLSARVCGALLIMLLYRLSGRYTVECFIVVSVALSLASGVFGIVSTQTAAISPSLTLASIFISGMGYMWLSAMIYAACAQYFTIRRAIIVIVAAQASEQFLSISFSGLLPDTSVVALGVFLPLLACIAFVIALKFAKQITATRRTQLTPRAAKLSGSAEKHMIVLLFCAALALVMGSALSTVGFWGNIRSDFFYDDVLSPIIETILSCLLLILLGYFTLYRIANEPLTSRYQIPFLVLTLQLVLSLLYRFGFDDVSTDLQNILAMTLEFFGHALFWTIVVASVQNVRYQSYCVIGGATAVCSTLSLIWVVVFDNMPLAVYAIPLAVWYVLICFVALSPRILNNFYKKARKLTIEEKTEQTLQGESSLLLETSGTEVIQSLQSRCRILGTHYGLSARETEVLCLLAQGRTQPVIMEELIISNSTIKTHVTHIYSKMGIHSRQEIFDLVYNESKSRGITGSNGRKSVTKS